MSSRKAKALNKKLLDASRDGILEEVERLIKEGVDIEAKDLSGWNSLMWASLNGYKEMVELLLKNKADIEVKDSNGWTALMYASANGHKEIVEMLLEAGADISVRTNKGDKAIHFARNVEMAQVLIANYADPEAIGSNNQTLLQKLQCNPESNQELIRYLKEDLGIPEE
jgi:ankyrin repeat protein